jgi:hypothetical protein
MTQQLLKIRGLKIEGKSDEIWNPIVNGLDLDLIFEERGLDIYYMEKLIDQQRETREAAKKLQ